MSDSTVDGKENLTLSANQRPPDSRRSVPTIATDPSPAKSKRRPRLGIHRQHKNIPGPNQSNIQHNIISRDELESKLSELSIEGIITTATNHVEYVYGERTLRNLPRFDGCEDLIPGTDWQTLLLEEITKLVEFAKDPSPPLFHSHGRLQTISRDDFNLLGGLADQIYCNLSILQHENARVFIEKGKTPSRVAWSQLLKTRKTLSERYAQAEMQVEGSLPQKLSKVEDNFCAYCALVDYILSVFVWWMVRSVSSKYAEKQVFANLARWAIKLKALAKDPIRAAEQALSDTADLFTTQQTQLDFRNEILIVKVGEEQAEINTSDTATDPTALYLDEKLGLGMKLGAVITNVLGGLYRSNESPNPSDSFEICTLVYQTGLEGETTMLHGARNGEISASSNLKHINFCFSSYLLLKSNTERIYEARQNVPVSQKSAVSIRWNASDALNGLTTAQPIVHCMDHVVSLLVPAALSTPKCATQLSELISIAYTLSKTEDRVAIYSPPKKDFSLEYVLTTAAWRDKMKQSADDKVGDHDIQPLSQSPARQLMRHSSQGILPESPPESPPTATVASDITKSIVKKTQDYESAINLMRSWKIAPTYVKIECRNYVVSMIAIAALIVLGGLAIAFSVQDRIRGVDPFNITLFSWILSVFFLLLAKSRYVSNWPSHDFLKGKVVCKSLSDLSDVSGLDTQVILLYLLHKEWKTNLVTSGPYNGLFLRRCDPRTYDKRFVVPQTEGFSIDRPVALSTMYAAGFVMLKVATMASEDLICLDGRKGGWDSGRHNQQAHWMTCRNFNEDILESVRDESVMDSESTKEERGRKVNLLQRLKFEWKRVIGVYTKESYFG